jgi:hypothetical protein
MTMSPISSNAKIGLGVAIAGGLAATLYYFTRPAAAATISTPVATSGGSPPSSTPVVTTTFSSSPQTLPVTAADSGKTFKLNKGDTLEVTLPVSISAANYQVGTAAATPPVLTQGELEYASATATQQWIATNSGTQQINYQALSGAGSTSGSPITFTVVVT